MRRCVTVDCWLRRLPPACSASRSKARWRSTPAVASQAEVWLGADDADVGGAENLKVAERIDARVGKLVVHGVARGRRLADLLDHSEFTADLEAGQLVCASRTPARRPASRLTGAA
jgi:hypothetical protein